MKAPCGWVKSVGRDQEEPCIHCEEHGLDCTIMGLGRREVAQSDLCCRGNSLGPHRG